MSEERTGIAPDGEDWTWVLDERCPQCGYDASSVALADLGTRVRENAGAWVDLVASTPPDAARRRPDPTTWSLGEYTCHVRDVHGVFDGRLRSMLEQDDPLFENWDQDETALVDRYDRQDPAGAVARLALAAATVAATYDRVPDDAWNRPGRRSNGSAFTVASLGRYHLHDVVHHLWDVTAR